MYPDTQLRSSQLFQFMVPGFPAFTLAITMQEVLEVTELPEIVPIPFAPPYIMGISKWRDELVTVVDLALKLLDPMPSRQYAITPSHYLIAQVVLGGQLEMVAWPILTKAGVLTIPSEVFKAESPPDLFAPMVHTTVALADQPVTILNLEGIM
jgi:chemotaxis signal transduction protein